MNIDINDIWAEVGKLHMQVDALQKENARLEELLKEKSTVGSTDKE